MIVQLSRHFNVDASELERLGVLNAHLGIDNRLFVDPQLLEKTSIPEFANARQDLTKYFASVIKLLSNSTREGDLLWDEAKRRLRIHEEHGAALGYSGAGGHGRGIGPELASTLVRRCKEIVSLGINDPEFFELLGLFQEDFGPDLLSDMAVAILKHRFLAYTTRVTKELNLQPRGKFTTNGQDWSLPLFPDGKRPMIFVPTSVLNQLPVALDRGQIDQVALFNRDVREAWNRIVSAAAKKHKEPSKQDVREILMAHPENLKDLIQVYKRAAAIGYDFKKDEDGLLTWERIGRSVAQTYPLTLQIKQPKDIGEVRQLVHAIIQQFKRNIENNRLYEVLYGESGKPRHEVFAQRLFYAIADSYCQANDIDLSREPNAGDGPVDFKLSLGYAARVLVEIKKSTNPSLLHGFETQLPSYAQGEATEESVYVVLRVGESDRKIKDVLSLREKGIQQSHRVPEVVVIDARKIESASKRRKSRKGRRR